MQNPIACNLWKQNHSGKLTDQDLSKVLGKRPSVKDNEIKNKLNALKNLNKERINDVVDDDDDDDDDDDEDDDDDFRYLTLLPIPYFPDSATISELDNEDNDNFNDYVTPKTLAENNNGSARTTITTTTATTISHWNE